MATTKTNDERKSIDCRKMPESCCSISIMGSEPELMKLAIEHAVSSHGHKDTPELREQLRKMMTPAS